MRLEYFLLADKAESLGGKLYMLGGGWDTLNVMALPTLASYDIVASLMFEPAEAGTHNFELTLVDESGELVLGPVGGELTVPLGDGTPRRLMLVLNGPFPAAKTGQHAWRVTVDGKLLGERELRVQRAAPPADSERDAPLQPTAPDKGR